MDNADEPDDISAELLDLHLALSNPSLTLDHRNTLKM